MKYVFFSTGSWIDNASMVRVRELGKAMLDRGVEVVYAVDDVPFNRANLNVDSRAAVVFTSGLGRMSQLWKRRRTLAELRPDFVHVLNPAAKTCAALIGSKFAVVGDWDEWPMMRPNYGLMRRTRERFFDHWLRHRARLILVASRYMQEQFKARFGLEATYIPYATYLQDHPQTTSPYSQRTAVYMGNLYPEYDHDLLFKAAALLKSRGETPAITFLGSGPQLETWRTFVKDHQLTNVNVAGFVTGVELWRHLRHAHVLLFPIRPTLSNLARCPSKTFAYAQTHRPVIANRTGEIPMVLGDLATYIDTTPEAFATAITQALATDLPDVDYQVEQHNWPARADVLLKALGEYG